jgi:hypothetical protein
VLLVLAACGDSRDPSTLAASSSPVTGTFWIAGAVPDGYHLVMAHDSPSPHERHSSAYRNVDTDPFDAELTIDTFPSGSPELQQYSRGSSTSVRGHPAILSTLTDEGHSYGIAFEWEERSGVTIVVRAAEPLTEADGRLVAEGVQPIDDDTWHKLVITTDPVAVHDGRVTPDMRRVPAATGVVGGDEWTLTALIPPGYPLLPDDRRAACFELAFRGETTNGTSCVGHPSVMRLGGQLFAMGEVPDDVPQVRITSDAGDPSDVDTEAAAGWDATRFWVAPLPDHSCLVTVQPTTGTRQGPPFGLTGPLDEPQSHDDWVRCLSSVPNGPPTTVPPPTTPAN